jgi:hypothetical protein
MVAIAAVLFVTIAPAFDLDPTALRGRRNADQVFWTLAAIAEVVLGLISVFASFLVHLPDAVGRSAEIVETTACWLC